jgi:hypothetical protein
VFHPIKLDTEVPIAIMIFSASPLHKIVAAASCIATLRALLTLVSFKNYHQSELESPSSEEVVLQIDRHSRSKFNRVEKVDQVLVHELRHENLQTQVSLKKV